MLRPRSRFSFGFSIAFAAALATMTCARAARAAPSRVEDELDERVADGDLDEEDRVLREGDAARALGPVDGGVGASDAHGASFVGVMAFDRQLLGGRVDVGGLIVVGLALDRVATGPLHRLADPPAPRSTPGPAAGPTPASAPTPPPPLPAAPSSASPSPSGGALALSGSLARDCVDAALRTSGLGSGDVHLDELGARSRESALLPETRLRAMRLWNDTAHETTLATSATDYYAATGANLVLELRLTWRLDRWLYAGDEPALERLRLERQDARARVATRALDALFAWQRGAVDAATATPGSHEEYLARLRSAEAAATLDVLTGGWFSERGP